MCNLMEEEKEKTQGEAEGNPNHGYMEVVSVCQAGSNTALRTARFIFRNSFLTMLET